MDAERRQAGSGMQLPGGGIVESEARHDSTQQERSCMNRDNMRGLDEYRLNHAGPLENDLIDVLAEGGMDRQDFIKRATVLGLSVGAIGAALGAYDTPLAFGAPAARKVGGRIRVGITPPPTKEIEPHTFADQGGLETGGISGEFLTRATQSLTLKSELALSWKPNKTASEWTFALRKNVKFANGAPVHRRRRRHDVQAPHRPELGLAGPLGLQRRPLPERDHEGRRLHGQVHAGRADGELPVSDELDDLPGDRPPEGLQARHASRRRRRRRVRSS